MTALAAIAQAIRASGLDIPYGTEWYDGSGEAYITYNYAADHGADFGDDDPGCNLVSVQVHLFLPLKRNFQTAKKTLRAALGDAGFTWPAVDIIEENDTNTRHLIFSCEFEETI